MLTYRWTFSGLCKTLAVIATTGLLLVSLGAPAAGAGGLVKPDFCYVTGGGTADAVVTFVLSKKNLINAANGGDNADAYEIERGDGQRFLVGRNEPRNIHDRTSFGQPHSYKVAAVSESGQKSRHQPCVSYDVVSSVSPGHLRDWRRPAPVLHEAGAPAQAGSARTFTGADYDAVSTVAAPAESARLNPAGSQFAFQAQLRLDAGQHRELLLETNPSWNVMQRGFATSLGGQWKMSLTTTGEAGEKVVRPQCIVRDQNRRKLQVNSTYRLQADQETTVTCVIDDKANTIQIIVNGWVDAVRYDPNFGDVNPQDNASTCWKNVANTVTVGNKPLCRGSLTDDDRFQGTISSARIFKGES